MDGTGKGRGHDIGFQARAGSPELNCCSVNGARGFGMISDWAVMSNERGLILNWYGPSTVETALTSGVGVVLRQETDYPRREHVRLFVEPKRPSNFALYLRVPHWSKRTEVKINGKSVDRVEPGTYVEITRLWKSGDTVDLAFDFSLQFWVGERECANKVAVYRGPLLLTYDRRFNEMDPDVVPAIDAKQLTGRVVNAEGWLAPILLMEFTAVDGRKLSLCDFASAGSGGSPYRSWLPVQNAIASDFSRNNPRRSSPS